MELRKILFISSLSACALCLAAGFGVAGKWVGTGAALLSMAAWLLARRYPLTWAPPLCLTGCVGLALVGRLSGAPAVWMICAAGLALATWDLLLLDATLEQGPANGPARRLESSHLRTLALLLGASLALACLGRLVSLHIPFMLLLLLIILALFGWERAWKALKGPR
jgi:hypothetical protein